jgi:DNA-binding MarR family transcriptional regulator
VTALHDRLGYLLKHAQLALSEHTGAALSRFHVDGRELAVLTVLADADGALRPLAQHEAAKLLGVDRTTMVDLLDRLEEKGLVERRPDPADRRRKLVQLTPAGTTAVTEGGEAARQAERTFLAALTPAETDQLRDLLQRALGRPA